MLFNILKTKVIYHENIFLLIIICYYKYKFINVINVFK